VTLNDSLEFYICVILTVEFYYDYWYNTREQRIKRRKNAKKEVVKQGLREGKSVFLQEAKGEVCHLPETTEPLQAKVKS
jgi:hypothetical protein